MDTSQYLPMFLAECREHLQELNLAVVRIEEQPEDGATVDEIFRIAHSLKGMSATMGFAGMAALTHQMEDVFELLRQRTGGLTRETVDVVLECLDALEAATDAIEVDGVENLEPAALIERLKGLVRDRTTDQQVARHGGAAAAPAPAAVVEAVGTGHAMLHARVTLADDTLMPAVRAYMVIAAAADMGTVVASAPEVDDVEAFDGRRVDVWVAAGVEAVALSAALTAVPDVATAEVAEVAEAGIVGEPEAELVAPVPVPVVAGERGEGGRVAATVRVDAERLDQLMHLMGELVVQRTQVVVLAAQAEVPGLSQAMTDLTRCSHALQAIVMQVRMIPVEAVFLRFPRLVRDLSTKFGKHVELELVGQDTELDRTVVDAIGDPLVHLVRNALDHGLEPPAEREAAGKPAAGTLYLSARHAGGNVILTVADAGRGINPRRVAEKAAERGLIDPGAVDSIDMARAVELLFTAGFSTAEVTSDISGRGVGMDAVRAAIRGLGGEVLMTSEPGAGSTAQIRLPLTLAIMAALIVEADRRPFAIPLDRIERTVRVADQAVRSVAGRRMLVLSDGVLPIVDASERYGGTRTQDAEYAVVVRGGHDRFALTVSRMIGQHELVTRPLPPEVSEGAALSGAAVLSDGQIALIVDCDALVDVPVSA